MLLDTLQADLRTAQLNRDEVRISTLRLLLSEVKNREIALRQSSPQQNSEQAEQTSLSDDDVINIIQRELKKRKEAAEGFRSGGREDSATKEELEAKVLADYLPQQMNNEELTKLVSDTISEACQLALVNGSEKPSLQDMGKIIRSVMEKVKGRADGGTVSALVKEKLSK